MRSAIAGCCTCQCVWFCYNTHRSCSCPAQAQVLPLCEAQLVCCWCVCIGFPAACSGGVAALLLHSAQQPQGCILRVCAFLCILHTHLCSSANCSQTACQMPLECMASVGRIIQTSANTDSCGDESVCWVNIRTAHPVLFGDTSCWCTV